MGLERVHVLPVGIFVILVFICISLRTGRVEILTKWPVSFGERVGVGGKGDAVLIVYKRWLTPN